MLRLQGGAVGAADLAIDEDLFFFWGGWVVGRMETWVALCVHHIAFADVCYVFANCIVVVRWVVDKNHDKTKQIINRLVNH